MANPRFYIADFPQSGTVVLDAAETKHAMSSLRIGLGDHVAVFDGRGGEAIGTVTGCQKRAMEITLGPRTNRNVELPAELAVCVALPKGDRQKVLVDGLVQLGVTRLIPLQCARGVAQPSGAALERLSRYVIESSKQCGRNQLMHVASAQSVPQLAAQETSPAATSAPSNPNGDCRIVAHPYDADYTLDAILNSQTPDRTATVVVGPEGGFTEGEIAQFQTGGWKTVSLGPRILRIEMAALMLASCLAAGRG